VGITAFPFSSVIDVPTARILGRDDAGTGSAEALTNTEIFAILGTGTPSASTYLRGDGTWSAVSAGISSLNGLTAATQVFAVGTTGTDVAFVSATGTHTLNIPDASATARGLVTTGTQTFQGVKTFSQRIVVNGNRIDAPTLIQFFLGVGCMVSVDQYRRLLVSTTAAVGFSVTADAENDRPADMLIQRDGTRRLRIYSASVPGPSTGAASIGVYNTYTSDTSWERLGINWASNLCTITTEKGSAGGTLRGLKIGDATTALLGFYGATPVDQPATVTDPTGGGTIDAEARTAINTIIDRLQELGLIA